MSTLESEKKSRSVRLKKVSDGSEYESRIRRYMQAQYEQ